MPPEYESMRASLSCIASSAALILIAGISIADDLIAVDSGDLDKYWTIIDRPLPELPLDLMSSGGAILIEIEYEIGSDGKTANARVLRKTPEELEAQPFLIAMAKERYAAGPLNPERSPVRTSVTITLGGGPAR